MQERSCAKNSPTGLINCCNDGEDTNSISAVHSLHYTLHNVSVLALQVPPAVKAESFFCEEMLSMVIFLKLLRAAQQ